MMTLNEYRGWFKISLKDFLAKNNLAEGRVHENVRYEKLTAVTRVDFAEGNFFFFQDSKLKLIYISHDEMAGAVWRECGKTLDPNFPDATLRSRAGKTSNQLLFASHGVCASVNNDTVDFIELFSPCDLDEYMRTIYREPGLFIR